jgi:hypothetical protein
MLSVPLLYAVKASLEKTWSGNMYTMLIRLVFMYWRTMAGPKKPD